MHTKFVFLLAIALLIVAGSPSLPGQYAPGDVVITDQNGIGSNWPLYGITPRGVLYTVTANLSFYAWSLAPAPDNRTLWASGKGNLGYTTATIAPDGTITNFNIDFAHLFSCIDVDGGGNAILGNLVGPTVNKYAGGKLTTLFTGAPLNAVQGGGIDLFTGDLVVLDSNGPGIYQVKFTGTPSASTVIASVPRPSNGAGLHADPASGTMIGSWGSTVYQLAVGAPGVLTTLKTGLPFGMLGALDRDPFDGQFVIPSSSNTAAQPSMVFRYDAASNAVTTLVSLPASPRISPLAATVAGSRHLCAGNEAQPGQAFSLMVSSPNEPGALYVVAVSFGYSPGIPLTGNRKVYLMPDDLFNYSLTNTGIFSNFQGVLNGKGEGIATMQIPNIPTLSGFRFFAAAVTVNMNQISVISDTLGVTIR